MKVYPIIFSLFLCLILSLGSSFAANNNLPVVREHILKQIQSADKLIEQKKYNDASALLNNLSEAKLSSYERSQVIQLQAFQFYKVDDYEQAIKAYMKILALDSLPQFTYQTTRYSLSQLYFSTEDYKAANKILKHWFKSAKNPGAQAYELQGQIYYQLELFKQAVAALQNAITVNAKNNKPPKQNWLQMLQSMTYKLGEKKQTILVLQQLIKHYPKKIYWLQLSGLYGERDDIKNQLAVLDSAYVQNLLVKETELKTLAYLYLEMHAPYKASKILQQGLKKEFIQENEKNLILLASAHRLAKEIQDSIIAMQAAAKLAEHGNIYAELAQLYLLNQQYGKSVFSARKAIIKGELKHKGKIYNTLGIAQFKLQKYDDAHKAFETAEEFPDGIKLALQWKQLLISVR